MQFVEITDMLRLSQVFESIKKADALEVFAILGIENI